MAEEKGGTGASRRRGMLFWATLLAADLLSAAIPAAVVNYDIVYVRWPRKGDNTLVMLPQGEDPYHVEPDSDLVLLHPDGTQRVLVDCASCCVQDPMVSFDGEWVYYTKMLDATNQRSPSFLFKMRIGGSKADFKEVQLTYGDGFTGYLHAGNDTSADDLGSWFSIRDMGPCPLPGGKIAFTSNRHADIAFRQGSAFEVAFCERSSVMQLYVMDDHDGSLKSAELSNLRQVGFGNLHMVQHPIILQDGRLLFSNWDDAGGKFEYAMTTLYAIRPDGSGLAGITEPHDRHKNVDHYATQLSNGDIVTGQYYPSFDFGYGHLVTFPIDVPDPAYTKNPSPAGNTYDSFPISFRDFDRKGWISLTPHTSPTDCPAPNLSGKYAMPAAAPLGSMLTAYSPGGVNHFSGCNGGVHAFLESGIYLIPDAEDGVVTDPTSSSQLVKLLNSSSYNEIWPRPVVSYASIHGMAEPAALPWTDSLRPGDDRIEPGSPLAVVGTSSLYNRESTPLHGDDFRSPGERELHSGAWTIQGTDVGIIKNSDLYAVRIVGVVPKPFRKPIEKGGTTLADWQAVSYLLNDDRADRFVEGYASAHHERWKIIAEIPLRKTDAAGATVLDARGDPDTSFAAKIPANTPFFFQGIDKNGMTLFSELTWRTGVPGEARTDCGGCHAHSIAPLAYSGTASGKRAAIKAPGLASADPMISAGLWDVTARTPILTSDASGNPSVRLQGPGMVGIEYFRDVLPILQRRCVSCHATSGNTTGTDLAFDGTTKDTDPYFRLAKDRLGKYGGAPPGGSYSYPQISKYVRANQARQSLLAWKLFGSRLDGRANADRSDDLDFAPHSKPHGATLDECRAIARWIDLGCPIDFQGSIHAGYRYTDDDGLPIVHIASPKPGANASFDGRLRLGIADAESGVDWSSVQVSIDLDLTDGVDPAPVSLAAASHVAGSSVLTLPLPAIAKDKAALLEVTAFDNAGNMNRSTCRFWVGQVVEPPPPAGGTTIIIDNGDPGTSSVGAWPTSGASTFFDANSLYSKEMGATYSWTTTLSTPGMYAVYAWWASMSTRVTAAPYTVTYQGGSAVVTVDQTQNGGQWNLLGTYPFGTSATVSLMSTSTSLGTSADAIKLVFTAPANAAPTARIVSITPSPVTAGSPVAFTGSGTDTDGQIAAYEWRSSLAGVLSTQASFSTSALAAGTHTISLRVKDDDGAWSADASQALQVNAAPPSGQRIVIDNGGMGTSFTGTWKASGGTSPYGAGSLYARGPATYAYRFASLAAGSYDVYAWWTTWSSRASSVPIDILHSSGTARVTVDQRVSGGQWNLLGRYTLGATATVTINAVGTSTTCADAISLVPASALPPPPPPSNAIIIDNGAAGTSFTGEWDVSSAPSPYGASSIFSNKGATYTYTTAASGTFNVYAWWTVYSSRNTAAPITITHAGGSTTVSVNQQANGGKWNLLGKFTFAGQAKVRIDAPGSPTTCADAVKLEPAP